MKQFIHARKILTGNISGSILTDHVVEIDGSRIVAIVPFDERIRNEGECVDAASMVLIPGFVQTHIHLCQTLFRGLADDLELLDWLQKKIFPFEAAHDEHSIYSSTMVGIAELLRSGTTTILDMGSIHHEEQIIRAIGETGLRAHVGKAMMDMNDAFPRLKESTHDAITSTRTLAERWHNSYEGRVKYAAAPRFVLSCSETLLRDTAEMMRSFDGMLYHTHASENKGEVEAVRSRCGMENIEYLNHLNILSEKTCLAHCIHLNDHELKLLQSTRTSVAHCPSSNLKLGSGIANIPSMMARGINVSLGADGAPCNNSLDMFREMRLASLIQKPFHGPTSMNARDVFTMATMGGAKALGLEHEIGSIEVGKKADLVLLDLGDVWNPSGDEHDLYSSIVHSASPENVDSVMIDGRWVYRKKEFTTLHREEILSGAKRELKQLLDRTEYS